MRQTTSITPEQLEKAFQRFQQKTIAVNPFRRTKNALMRLTAFPLTHEVDLSILDKHKEDYFILECLYDLFDELDWGDGNE